MSTESLGGAVGWLVAANGTQLYVEETGEGPPLVLLHGATISTSAVWSDFPWSWRPHLPRLAGHFRVIAADTRGHGRSPNPGGPVSYDLLAADLVALIEALGLRRPALCGFSDGGHVVSLVGMRHPELASAIVNYAGYDLFNPAAASMQIVRTRQGGSAEATEPEFEQLAERIGADRLARIQQDHDAGQGEGAWRRMFRDGFARWTQPGQERLADFARITAPTLIEVGDRDPFCSVEEACQAYRFLAAGELAVLPNLDHSITPAVVEVAVEFLVRHRPRG
jgi:pimeloyl-ACP methyl ester carboxylesterase